jgi:hypothetical protein
MADVSVSPVELEELQNDAQEPKFEDKHIDVVSISEDNEERESQIENIEPTPPIHFRPEKKRFLIILLFTFFSFSNAMNWITYGSVSETITRRYNVLEYFQIGYETT